MVPKTPFNKVKASIRWLVPIFSLTIAGCAGSPGMLSPASPQANQISTLFWSVLAIAAGIFIVTEALLIAAMIRFRSRRSDLREPDQVHGNIRLETAWTVAPALILVGVFAATVATMTGVTQPQPNEMPVKVIGHQWWWEIQYPGMAITTATDLHIPTGRPIALELTTVDVIHSFWAPEIAGKIDEIPGETSYLRFSVPQDGVFRGQCAEYCGTQHANMGFEIIAEPAAQFEQWQRQMQFAPSIPTEGQAGRGAQALLTGTCIGCHTINGTAARGKVGPDLSHFGSRRSIGGLTLENTPANLAAWLNDPQAAKPGNNMRIPKLNRDTIDDLVTFLEGLK